MTVKLADSELAQTDIGSLELDIFTLIKKHGRKKFFCVLGRRLLDNSFTKM